MRLTLETRSRTGLIRAAAGSQRAFTASPIAERQQHEEQKRAGDLHGIDGDALEQAAAARAACSPPSGS